MCRDPYFAGFISSIRRLAILRRRLRRIFRNTEARLVENGNIVHRVRIAGVGCLAIPGHRLHVIPRHAMAVKVKCPDLLVIGVNR